MMFKNQRSAYFGHVPPTTHAHEQQDLRDYWTKVHEILPDVEKLSLMLTQQSTLRYTPIRYETQRTE